MLGRLGVDGAPRIPSEKKTDSTSIKRKGADDRRAAASIFCKCTLLNTAFSIARLRLNHSLTLPALFAFLAGHRLKLFCLPTRFQKV